MADTRLSVKVFGGFSMVLVLLALVALCGYLGMNAIQKRWEKSDIMGGLVKAHLEARRHEKNFILRFDQQYVDKVREQTKFMRDLGTKSRDMFSDPEDLTRIDAFLESLGRYEAAFAEFAALFKEEKKGIAEWAQAGEVLEAGLKKMREQMLVPALRQARTGQDPAARELLEDLFDRASSIAEGFLHTRLRANGFLLRRDQESWDSFQASRRGFEQELKDFVAKAKGQAGWSATLEGLDQQAALYGGLGEKLLPLAREQQKRDTIMVEAGRTNLKAVEDIRDAQKVKMMRELELSKLISLVASLAAMLVGLGLAVAITLAVTKPVRRIAGNLSQGASQLTQASNEVSESSQSLAEGASQQAAALEQTSASLEELSAMTRRNAENAGQANQLMGQTKDVVTRATTSMRQLREAMERINDASNQTAQIIKTIDEIAFQTNLLALNAAVEAARAGQAGAGFAVVADEVRALAMRAADAARNTQHIIEGTLQNVREGSGLVKTTHDAFDEVEGSALKVGELVGEITAASQEQAQGIDHIHRAVSEMDKVTQQVAANAEEGAAASEEMSAQSGTLQDMVGDLIQLVAGTRALDLDELEKSRLQGARRGLLRRGRRQPKQLEAPESF